ncbi:MAG: hypothetical protein QOE84_3668 [Actinomycetota bacterium]|nr:hypothetical protein [Actinomycetota bacterium]
MLRADAGWCGQCFAPVGSAAGATATLARDQVALPTYTRWRKTDTKFGPFGRMAWTVLLVLGLALCLFSWDPFAIVAMVVVGGVVLKSVWARSRLS